MVDKEIMGQASLQATLSKEKNYWRPARVPRVAANAKRARLDKKPPTLTAQAKSPSVKGPIGFFSQMDMSDFFPSNRAGKTA